MLNLEISNHRLAGIKLKPTCPILSHLFFADDAILFLKADKDECGKILAILDLYNAASVVGDLIDNNTKAWKEDDIRSLVSREEADLILSIPISQMGNGDSLWTISVMDHLDSAIDGPSCMGKIMFLAWQIWKSRNDWVFNHIPVDPQETMAKANFGWSEFQGSLGNQEISRHHMEQVTTGTHWECPEEGWVKANCDVTLKKGSPKAAIAVVLRNYKGEVLDGCSSLVDASSISHPRRDFSNSISLSSYHFESDFPSYH
ncbi:hypothetical protein RHSIM_Rhsim01G0199300 [Rhododendron simsii]|uniref:Uncharacterized protein n=1 Tax=Rhododendron simsii TaxID=118357 RepID=A0A834HDT4_RHOSS|nr:hypothetical protein RHSIM_Rhsim01G0199300 [Rhododendron simsii]